ncbi:hypothetical protein [Streptomonospora litoralis]|uniref:Stress response protein YvgO n=1 Tax=Streptomonospora litoralis TaxID=2498135 RepID=A0A4P6Q510_9ACTN|nr:hypothetical protein [Streptomonospora litoralis]QBI54069.1 Stress response protein YvgO precursor [Streptomonospora litoralis]
MQLTKKAAAVLALAGAATAGAPAAAQASDYLDPCDLRTKIDELQGWGSDTSKNIIVYKATARESSHFEGVVSRGTTQAKPCENFWPSEHDYHWVVFSGDGEFVRKGDGGYRNWAFFGVFTRDGNVVDFHAR